jgi:hypothetical protein
MGYIESNLLLIPITDESGNRLEGIPGSVEISLSVVIYNELSDGSDAIVKEPIRNPIKPVPYKEMLNSGTLLSQKFESDRNGNAVIDLTTMLSNKNVLKLIYSYRDKYSFILRVKFSVFKTDEFYPYDEIIANQFKYEIREGGVLTSKNLELDGIALESLGVKYSLSELKDELKRVEDLYTVTKSNIEKKISLSDKEIEISANEYEPANFNLVVTRLLELKEGTLNAGLSFCEQYGLKKELDILNQINRNILRMSEIYPKIKLEDGEGIPYSGPTRANPAEPKQQE